MNGRLAPQDANERRRALDSARSYLVQAPAGSGKTGLLIQRYLALLATVSAPEEVVAITFTRKATGEMRGRVLAALANAHNGAPEDLHQRATWELAVAVSARDRQLGWDLEVNPARLRILTIDALCHHLARQMPVLARFGGEVAPVDDPEPLYHQAARRTLTLMDEAGRYGDAVKVLLTHLDNDIARFESMLRIMLARRDQWLRYLAAEELSPVQLRTALESSLRAEVEDALVRIRRGIPPQLGDEIVAVAEFAGDNLKAAGADSPVSACAGLESLPAADADQLLRWRGIAALLLKKDGGWRKSFNVNDGFPPGKNPRAVEMKTRAKGLCASLTEDDGLREALSTAQVLPQPVYQDEEFSVLVALLDVLRVAAAMLRVVFAERGGTDFIEMVNAARTALGEEDAPTDLALALDYHIRHLLVDEFQDTSHTHFSLLGQLTSGWTPGDGKTLFLVGDPMQSIYRFREADVGVYLNAWHHGMRGMRLELLTLTTNFRSSGDLVEWVNEIFPHVLAQRDDASIGAVAYRPATAWHPATKSPAVILRALPGGGEREEAQAVVGCVQQAVVDDPTAHVAVLVRSRSHLREILPAFDQAGIAYRGVELRAVLDAPAVHDLISLTRALIHPADRVAWLAVLRAPWCGLRLEDLDILIRGAPEATLPELLADPDRVGRLSSDGRARLGRTAKILLSALNERGRRGIRRQVEGVWQALGGPALAAAADLADANACLDMIERYELEQRVVDIDALEARLADLRLTPAANEGAVEIMTIHKAKGLEFDCVIVPGLHRRGRPDKKKLLAWTQRVGGESASELMLAPLPLGDEADPAAYGFLDAMEKKKQALESARLLYVASTRAKRRLYLVATAVLGETPGDIRPPEKSSLLARLWPALEVAFKQAAETGGTEIGATGSGTRAAIPELHRVESGWETPPPPTAISWPPALAAAPADAGAEPVEFEWAGYAVRHVGSLVHTLLKRIADEGPARWSQARIRSLDGQVRAMLASEGVIGDELNGSVVHVLDALERVIEDPRGRWILDPEHRRARNELPLSGMLDGRLVSVAIDRSFIDDSGTRWIVDYKSGRHEGADPEAFLNREQQRYKPQLERYARLMWNLEKKPLRVGLYFPLLRGWREWAPEIDARDKR